MIPATPAVIDDLLDLLVEVVAAELRGSEMKTPTAMAISTPVTATCQGFQSATPPIYLPVRRRTRR